MKMKRRLIGLAFTFMSCATVPSSPVSSYSACGDPCATRSCPTAFVCTVDTHCVARCQPEPVKPGMP